MGAKNITQIQRNGVKHSPEKRKYSELMSQNGIRNGAQGTRIPRPRRKRGQQSEINKKKAGAIPKGRAGGSRVGSKRGLRKKKRQNTGENWRTVNPEGPFTPKKADESPDLGKKKKAPEMECTLKRPSKKFGGRHKT